MKKILFALAAIIAVACCAKKAEGPAAHPAWTYNAVMYEVNIRQFSPEGTFKAVEEQLPRLSELG
ncbi:MAG: alpha-amylase, partial [Bacteroidales bacterium]|nr:alpha-amylase [Bacteroidales bacterium]